MPGKTEQLLFNQIFGDNLPSQNDLPEGDQYRRLAEELVPKFDACVDYLREKFPNEQINQLMTLFWRLVGNKITPSALTPAVQSVSFWAEVRGTEKIGVVLMPVNWLSKLDKDLYMQLGALVFTASQAKDYYQAFIEGPALNIFDSQSTRNRALAYEAEYLLTLIQIDEQFTPNEYQLQVLNTYPRGVAS